VSFADAASESLDASLAQVDAIIADTESGITLESAPTKEATVSCTSNQEFEKNQCNKCFTKEIQIGDTILESSYKISNSESILRIAYKDEQEDPSFINIGKTEWLHSTQNPKYFWINGIDIMWLTNKYDNYNRAQYFIDKNKAPELYRSDL
jgi:hypothetical protein